MLVAHGHAVVIPLGHDVQLLAPAALYVHVAHAVGVALHAPLP